MAKGLRGDATTAVRRIASKSGGLSWLGARDGMNKHHKLQIPLLKQKEVSIKKQEKPKEVEVEGVAYDVRIGGKSCLLSTNVFEADKFFDDRKDKTHAGMEMFLIENGKKSFMKGIRSRGFKLDKVAQFRVSMH